MARTNAKREYRRRPGLRTAAKDLAVSYSHLRRVVIGDRTSVSLMIRYDTWKRQQQTAPQNTKPRARIRFFSKLPNGAGLARFVGLHSFPESVGGTRERATGGRNFIPALHFSKSEPKP